MMAEITQTDIQNLDDIKIMVNEFYSAVRNDALLSEIFNEIIEDRWPQHLEKMYRFWQTVLLSEHTYFGSPFPPHASMPISEEHFNRWKLLFYQTVDRLFTGEKANEAKWRAEKMASMFLMKINFYRDSSSKPLI